MSGRFQKNQSGLRTKPEGLFFLLDTDFLLVCVVLLITTAGSSQEKKILGKTKLAYLQKFDFREHCTWHVISRRHGMLDKELTSEGFERENIMKEEEDGFKKISKITRKRLLYCITSVIPAGAWITSRLAQVMLLDRTCVQSSATHKNEHLMEACLLPILVGAVESGNERAVRTVVDRLSEMELDISEHTKLLNSSIQVVAFACTIVFHCRSCIICLFFFQGGHLGILRILVRDGKATVNKLSEAESFPLLLASAKVFPFLSLEICRTRPS